MGIFNSDIICSDFLIFKIINKYDISHFNHDFIKKNYKKFKLIYNLDYFELENDEIHSDNPNILEMGTDICICKDVVETEGNYMINDAEYNKQDSILYNGIIKNNLNLVYIYDYYGDLLILEKVYSESILQISKPFKDLENRTDILLYIYTDQYFNNLLITELLKYHLFEYLLKIYIA